MGNKVQKEKKVFTAEVTINRTVQHYTEDSYDKTTRDILLESNELTTMTLKASTLKGLVGKIHDHTDLLTED